MITNLERIKKDIEELAKFNATPGSGLTRLSFTKEHKEAHNYIENQFKKAGLDVYLDPTGTIIGKREGTLRGAPAVMIGSHYDSVKNGGNFDGVAGVVTALEIARVLEENNITTKYPIEFVGMIEEEGTRFNLGLFSSRAMVGDISEKHLYIHLDEDGISIGKAMENFGLSPKNIHKATRKKEDIKAFLELHIEQGPILENKNKDIGIVNHIVGMKSINITIKGRPDHAGTSPMDMRIDALHASCNVINKINNFVTKKVNDAALTVGILKVFPGVSNIVPGKVFFTIDVRSKDEKNIQIITEQIEKELDIVEKEMNIQYKIEIKLDVKPVKLSEKIINILIDNCNDLNFTSQIMASGAAHDAMVMTRLTDVGMIFVPSKNGRSHCPEEWTDYEDLQKGIELALKTILDLAK